MRKRGKRILIIAAAVIVAAVVGVGVYLGDYYRADDAAVEALAGTAAVSIETDGRLTVFAPEEPAVGFIFYPGGKVEHSAYAPLLLELAENGVLCVLVEMLGNMAVLDMNAAQGIPEQFQEVEDWYIGGHSLGGSMAAAYAAGHSGELEGLVLLAAYSTKDLRESSLAVLSLYGSEDGVLDMEKYEQYRGNLPETAEELVLSGGNHAGFGSYGAQEGDGSATISPGEQRGMTVDSMLAFFERQGE